MAQLVPNATGLQVADVGEAYDRGVLFGPNASTITPTSIDVWVLAGGNVRAAIVRSDSGTTATGAVIVQDLGLFTNTGGSDAWINKAVTGSPTIAAGKFFGVVARQDTTAAGGTIATVGVGSGYPHGDAVYAWRSVNGYTPNTTPFPSPVFDDEGIDASNRIPYVRFNYNVGVATNPGFRTQPLRDKNNALLANVSGIEYCVRSGSALNGTVLLYGVDGATDALGVMTIDNDALGSVGASINGTVFKGDSTTNWNIAFKGTVADLAA